MGWYANLRIRNKLIWGYAVVVALSCLIGYYGIRGMRDLKALLDDTHDHLIRSLVIDTQIDHHSQLHIRQLLCYLESGKQETRQQVRSAMKRDETRMEESLGELEKVSVLPKERHLFTSIRRRSSCPF